jgi:hypothetical protein
VLSGIHQNNVLSALRGSELVADPTPLLALECARRRRVDRVAPTRLCTSQRLVRMQPAPKGLLPHFRLFGMVTAARGPSDDHVHLREHLAIYLRLLTTTAGFRFDDLTVSVSHTGAVAARLAAADVSLADVRAQVRTEVWSDPDALLAARGLQPMRGRAADLALPPRYAAVLRAIDDEVLAPLAGEFPAARLQLDLGRLEGLGYYLGPCVRITARDREGVMLPLTDGGFVDWTQRLLGDRRERFLITGIGSDLACARFAAPR